MEVARSVLSPTPSLPPPPLQPSPTAHRRATPAPSVTLIHDRSSRQVTSMARHVPAAFHQQGRYDKLSTSAREEKIAEIALHRRKINCAVLSYEEKYGKFVQHSRCQFPCQSVFRHTSAHCKEELQSSRRMEYPVNDADTISVVGPSDVVVLAQKAVSASQEAANLCGSRNSLRPHLDKIHFPTFEEYVSGGEQMISGRLLKRQSKRCRVLKKKDTTSHVYSASTALDLNKKTNRSPKSNDTIGIFLQHPDLRRFLTLKEERDLFARVQDLKKIEEVKHRLHKKFAREPTISEWAKAVEMSCHSLRLCIMNGNLSRDKMFFANLRLVIHVAKRYKGQGLNFQDLLQAGSMGLLKSFEKYNQRAGSRFGRCAYWWIRHSIRETLLQYSRDIRLTAHMHALLNKIKREKRACILEGHYPTKKDLAECIGIKVEKLERLLLTTRAPISLQKQTWAHQKVTIEEMIEDRTSEPPDLCYEKQMMRQHVRNLLEILPVRERQIIRLRYGIPTGGRKTLAEIGNLCGVSLERVRQIERSALHKLRGCIDSHGLAAYVSLIV